MLLGMAVNAMATQRLVEAASNRTQMASATKVAHNRMTRKPHPWQDEEFEAERRRQERRLYLALALLWLMPMLLMVSCVAPAVIEKPSAKETVESAPLPLETVLAAPSVTKSLAAADTNDLCACSPGDCVWCNVPPAHPPSYGVFIPRQYATNNLRIEILGSNLITKPAEIWDLVFFGGPSNVLTTATEKCIFKFTAIPKYQFYRAKITHA